MLISLKSYLEQVIDTNDHRDLLTLIGQRVMYRYHRESKKVYGSLYGTYLTGNKVYVKWDDGKSGWSNINSIEVSL